MDEGISARTEIVLAEASCMVVPMWRNCAEALCVTPCKLLCRSTMWKQYLYQSESYFVTVACVVHGVAAISREVCDCTLQVIVYSCGKVSL